MDDTQKMHEQMDEALRRPVTADPERETWHEVDGHAHFKVYGRREHVAKVMRKVDSELRLQFKDAYEGMTWEYE